MQIPSSVRRGLAAAVKVNLIAHARSEFMTPSEIADLIRAAVWIEDPDAPHDPGSGLCGTTVANAGSHIFQCALPQNHRGKCKPPMANDLDEVETIARAAAAVPHAQRVYDVRFKDLQPELLLRLLARLRASETAIRAISLNEDAEVDTAVGVIRSGRARRRRRKR